MAEAKPAMKMSFGFAKKAEPKRHVAALSTKKEDDREEIKGIGEGQLELEKPKEGKGPPVIKCKNPLAAHNAPKPAAPNGQKPTVLAKPLEELPGGIVSKGNMEKLSVEDAEAMRELLKDAAKEPGDDAPVVAAMPILMKEGSKKARDPNSAPEATREMFDNVPVENFGEAMLRGMGYDPSVHTTKSIFRDKLRDNCLGLGAKCLDPSEKMRIANKKKGEAAAKAKAKASGGGAASSEAAAPTEAAVTEAAADPAEPQQKRPRTDDGDAKSKPVVDCDAAPDIWASRGLVVRVISKEGQLQDFFGAEAVILEVDEGKQCCRIKARPNGSDKSQQLKGVRLQDIETRVSRDCQKVRIVRGAQKGVVAKLTKRDSAKGVAVLQIEGVETSMSLDDVCQFMG